MSGSLRLFEVSEGRVGVWRGLLALLVVWLGFSGAASAKEVARGVQVQPPPSWVKPLSEEGLAAPEAEAGVEFLAGDAQVRLVRGQETYFYRTVVRVINELGAKTLGEQKFLFMPPHQRLVLHRLDVRRGGQSTSALRPGAVQVLQRESNLESGVYDGASTVVVILSDLRVGDEVVAEYSLVGANPVLGGHVGATFALHSPVAKGRTRYRVTSDRPLELRLFQGAQSPALAQEGSLREFSWELENAPASRVEEDTPADAGRPPWVQLTDFRSWGEVASWGSTLFRVPELLPEVLKSWQREAERESDPGARAVKVLRMVQERVRYLSLAFAESSHRPAEPAQVLARGFGDCKDKSLLAVALFRALGFDADVALVSTTQGELLPQILPTSTIFDHAIVVLEHEGARHWLDPTRLYQRGTLADVAARGYRHALRLAPGVEELTPIEDPPERRSHVHAAMRFSVTEMGGAAKLDLSTTFVGASAEALRALRAGSSREAFKEHAAATVLKSYPRAEAGEPTVEDREASNEFVVHQSFALNADDWTPTEKGRALSILPVWLNSQLSAVPADRKAPLALTYPLAISHVIEVRTPQPVRMATDAQRVEAPGFELAYRVESSLNELSLRYDFASRMRRLEPGDFELQRRGVAAAIQLVDFSVLEPAKIAPASRTGLFTAVALWSVLLLALLWYLELKRPHFRLRNVRYRPELAGIGGWMILLALGVTLSPLRVASEMIEAASAYSAESWTNLTSEGSPLYDAGWASVLTASLLANMTMLVGACYSTYLFWSRRRSFPFTYTLVLGFAIVTMTIETIALDALSPAGETDAQQAIGPLRLIISIPVSVAWMVYLSRSERVKATFLRREPSRRRVRGDPSPA